MHYNDDIEDISISAFQNAYQKVFRAQSVDNIHINVESLIIDGNQVFSWLINKNLIIKLFFYSEIWPIPY